MAKYRVQFTLDDTDSRLFEARAIQRDVMEAELVAIAIHEFLHGKSAVPSVALHARRLEEAANFMRELERIGFTPRKIQIEAHHYAKQERLREEREAAEREEEQLLRTRSRQED